FRKLSVGFKGSELETLKTIFNSCQYLESIDIWCNGAFLSEKESLEMVAKHSPKNVCELNLVYHGHNPPSTTLLSEELESFFIIWANRIPQKSLSLNITSSYYYEKSFDKIPENMEIINKYIKLGVIKKFCR